MEVSEGVVVRDRFNSYRDRPYSSLRDSFDTGALREGAHLGHRTSLLLASFASVR